MEERNILKELKHPLLINMKYSFQTRSHLYLVMDLLSGGDMRYHFWNRVKFKEKETRFIIACIVLALEYIHSQGYLHRDIKPENLVFDEDGYVHVTDFGISKKARANNKMDTSGTPGYMAPEVMWRQNHTTSVDFFAAGVIAYEWMFQRRPFTGKTRKEIRDQMWNNDVHIRQSRLPYGWSYEAMDFINQWIKRKKFERLGHRGIGEVKNHPWFQDFDWNALYNKTLKAPFVPPRQDNFDNKSSHFIFKDDYSMRSLNEAEALMDRKINDIDEVQEMFKNYYFDYRDKQDDSRQVDIMTLKDCREYKTGTKPQTT